MARSNFVQNSFVSGELSEEIKARTDLEQYSKGLQTATNVVPEPQGGIKRRMGSQFVAVPEGPVTFQTSGAFTDPQSRGDSTLLYTLNDNNLETTYVCGGGTGFTPTVIDGKSISNRDNWVAWQYDLGSLNTSTVKFVDFKNIRFPTSTDTPESTEFDLESSTNGTDWTKQADIPKITRNFQDFRITIDVPQSVNGPDTQNIRYWRLIRKGTQDLGVQTLAMAGVNFMSFDESTPDGKYKMHSFEVDKDNSFLLFFTPTNLRIYRVTDTATTYVQDVDHGLGNDFPNRVAANENVLLLFNKNKPTKRLIYNYSNDGLFYYDNFPFTNVPRYDFDDRSSPEETVAKVNVTFPSNIAVGDNYQLEVDGVISKNIAFHGDSTTDERDATANAMRKNLQDMPVFGDSGITVTRATSLTYTVEMAGDSANDYDIMTGFMTSGSTGTITFSVYTRGNDTSEPIWSSIRGYPNLGVYAQGRLWIGGTRDKPQVLMASQTGVYHDFLVDKGEANEGFLFTMNGAKSAIVDVTGGRGVTVFTEGAEFAISGNTPATLTAEQQTQHGSFSSDVPTLALDGAILFIDRNGRSLRQFVYDYREEGYRSVDLSVLSSHLIKDPVDMDAVTSVTAKDANYVFIINADGSAVILNTLREQDINGFVKFDMIRTPLAASEILNFNTDFAGATDKFEQVVSVNNILHVLSEVGNSNNYTYNWNISRLRFDHLLDFSKIYQPKETPVSGVYYHDEYLSGLKHLKGNQPNNVILGNSVGTPRYLIQDNTLQLTDAERRLNVPIEVGRNFVPELKPMPINTVMRDGDNTQMALKRINRMNLRVLNSAGVNVDGVAVPVREFGDASNSPLNTSLEATTGIIEDNNGGNGWGREVVPKITVPDSTPFHLLAIDYEISS